MELFEYKEYIVKNGFVDTAKSEYYKNWVKNYLQMKISEKISENDRIRQYREILERDETREKWQVDQAIHAVVYLKKS
jgi:hypothetical protein